jgi:hypothetical protein
MKTLFDRLGQQQPVSETEQLAPEIVRRGPQPIIPPTHSGTSPSETLLVWLVNCWPKPTITLRDIQCYAPNSVRDPADIINLTRTLTEYGWLVPAAAWRRDMKKWRVVRKPEDRASAQA